MIKNDIQTNTNLQKFKKVTDLPESLRFYTIIMSTKSKYFNVSGEEVLKVMGASTNFIKLSAGNIINKAFIAEIVWDKEETISRYRKNHENENV